MTQDMRDRTADALLALIPLYYKNVIRHRPPIAGIQLAQVHTLGILTKAGSLTMSEIGSRLYISRPYMTRLADQMIADGLVERRPDPDDRRVIKLAITEKGKKYLRQSITWFKNDLKKNLSGLSDSDIGKLCTALEDTYRILSSLQAG
ncbi:transcriptional regulator, MarR family [Methanoregula boonei 6A8]|jgi:DNA-binding MarR family transcriptional regulator|uniref:Transcriptional regulator, MarR family n=1 Tax=Methanoregula boonei (strain DSM 21154 / JCM 14090 / 6A8) TaxID=456442 RepID=A7I5X2_METB6|nr:MarR family transcriptional regulator [Methanoregula boonei]ABS55133.1 transcriptional regulator, MarR family [Methanoregula boonei 6A8]